MRAYVSMIAASAVTFSACVPAPMQAYPVSNCPQLDHLIAQRDLVRDSVEMTRAAMAPYEARRDSLKALPQTDRAQQILGLERLLTSMLITVTQQMDRAEAIDIIAQGEENRCRVSQNLPPI